LQIASNSASPHTSEARFSIGVGGARADHPAEAIGRHPFRPRPSASLMAAIDGRQAPPCASPIAPAGKNGTGSGQPHPRTG
jgi:hypothetical protein